MDDKVKEQILMKIDELKELVQSGRNISDLFTDYIKSNESKNDLKTYIKSLNKKVILTNQDGSKVLGEFDNPKQAVKQSGYSEATVYRCLRNPKHITKEKLKFQYK